MILLDGHSLNRKIQFRPESQSLTLEERKGQSALTLGDGAPEIQVGDWMLDDTAPGAGIVWRVKTADTAYFREASTRTIQLEHIVNTLRDGVIFGELKWENGCTASAAISHILGLTGGLWTLGTFEPQNVSWPYKFNACTWMDALETVTRTLEDAWWDYDLSSLPFKLHIRSLAGQTDSEMRMSRNITGIRRSVDRSRMYTRFYPIGLNDMHLPEEYLSRNEEIYGTCCKIETNQAIDSEGELRSWARDRLKRHCEPIVTVTVSGLDLSRDTGEPLDALRLNRVCRVPLPEFGTTILEKVCRLQWPDKIKAPEKMNVTLANEKEDIASIFNQQAAGSEASRSGGGRGAKKKIEEDHAWFVDTSDHVAMVAEAIIGQGPDGVDWSRVAILSVDGYGIHGRVTRAENYVVTLASRLDMDEEQLGVAFESIASVRSELTLTAESLRLSFNNDIASVRSSITVTAESLRSAFESDIDSAWTQINQNAHNLSFKVGKGDVATELAVECGNVSISNGNLIVDGYIQSAALYTEIASLSEVRVQNLTAVGGLSIVYHGGTADVGNALSNVILRDNQNNTYTLLKQTLTGTKPTEIGTFSRATSTLLISGDWSGTTYTVAADANGQNPPVSTTVYLAVEGTPNPGATVYAKIYKDSPNDPTNQLDTLEMTLAENVNSKKVTLSANTLTKGSISTQATYNAGWLDSYGEIEVLPDEDVLLDYSDSQTVTVKAKTSPTGNLVTVSSFVISSKADRYSGGWGDSYAAIEVLPDEDVSLDPGDSQQILVKAKASPTASLSNLSNFTVSARALRLYDATGNNKLTANSTYTVPSGYDGFGTVVVDVAAASDRYADGWGDSYAAIEVTPDEYVLLDPGDSQQILVKAKATPNSSLSNLSNFTVAARALNLYNATGNNKLTANSTYTAPSGYDGFGTVVVDVPQTAVTGGLALSSRVIYLDSNSNVTAMVVSVTRPVLTYDGTTHKYTASASAQVDNTIVDTLTQESGTAAYNGGYSDGYSDGYSAGTSAASNPIITNTIMNALPSDIDRLDSEFAGNISHTLGEGAIIIMGLATQATPNNKKYYHFIIN